MLQTNQSGNHPTASDAPGRPKCFLRMAAVEQRLQIKKSAIYELVRRKELVSPVKISARCVGWLEEDIDRFIAERASARATA